MSTSAILPRVHIGEVIRNAVVFKPDNQHKRRTVADSIEIVVRRYPVRERNY